MVIFAVTSSPYSRLARIVMIGFPFLSSASSSDSKYSSDSTPRFDSNKDPFLGRVVATRKEMCSMVDEALSSKYRPDTEERLFEIAKEMRSTYLAMPKTAQGYLGDPATRYLLHRHFLRTRAWLVKGLAPDGGPWNASRPTALLNYSTPGTVRELFEQRLRGRGLDLQEVALLAAMIENQVHQDAIHRLHQAWAALELPSNESVSKSDVIHVLEALVTSYIYQQPGVLTTKYIRTALAHVPQLYSKWSSTQSFLRAALQRSAIPGQQEFSFDDAEQAVVEVTETYGEFQSGDCKELKMDLLALEGPRPGRVSLKDFFWQAVYAKKDLFGESVAYMRHTGLLDETDSANPSIIVPNYINSPSQFLGTSDTFALTCMDECERIMTQIEDKIGAPYATPGHLASAVVGISSETQPEREDGFSPLPLLRLEQIAEQDSQSGTRLVSLHGRLFAQWLHHAFPRECPYPHVSTEGVELLLPLEYGIQAGDKKAAYASDREKRMYADGPSAELKGATPGSSEDLPWDQTEELLAPRIAPVPLAMPQMFQPFFQAAVCIAVLIMLLRNLAFVEIISSAHSKIFKKLSEPCADMESELL